MPPQLLWSLLVLLPPDTTSTSPSTSSPEGGGVSPTHGPGGLAEDQDLSSSTLSGSTAAVSQGSGTEVTPSGPSSTTQHIGPGPVCQCDVTPLCDCCCDAVDCGSELSQDVSCSQDQSGFCVEKWLIFRANVDPSVVTATDSLLCFGPEAGSAAARPPPPSPPPPVGDSFHFSPGSPDSAPHSRAFYRVDDVIMAFHPKASLYGFLRQPSPGATAACVNRNPARFLRSGSMSCTRTVSTRSCTEDPALRARSYFSGFSLLKRPTVDRLQGSPLLIPVSSLSKWSDPSREGGSCRSVVTKVRFVIGITGSGELVFATVTVETGDVAVEQQFLQTHSVDFQLVRAHPPPATPGHAPGLPRGSPLIGRFNGTVRPLTILAVGVGGQCTSELGRRPPVPFLTDTIGGCSFSSLSRNCSELRTQLYQVLQGPDPPDLLAMNSGPEPDWSRVLTQGCPAPQEESCETGCVLPVSLSIQVLWARLGWLHLPQRYILGARFLFHCDLVQCPSSSSLAVSTEVRFADLTVYPEPPRGRATATWKLPLGFFSGGAELEAHSLTAGSQSEKSSLITLSIIILTGMEALHR